MRLIDADGLRKKILNMGYCYYGFADSCDKSIIIDEIDSMPTITLGGIKRAIWDLISAFERKWIPVEERLPDTGEMVLVSCRTKKGQNNVNRAYYENGYWHGSGSMSGVIAWMPLPEPYRGESDE